jgi:hypothetical protein
VKSAYLDGELIVGSIGGEDEATDCGRQEQSCAPAFGEGSATISEKSWE